MNEVAEMKAECSVVQNSREQPEAKAETGDPSLFGQNRPSHNTPNNTHTHAGLDLASARQVAEPHQGGAGSSVLGEQAWVQSQPCLSPI